jgi:cell division septation protein DedD
MRGKKGQGMARSKSFGAVSAIAVFVILAGCEDMGEFPLFSGPGTGGSTASTTPAGASATVIEQDVEAPDVFAVNEPGLWDGRPSLGGVWVAHPEVADAERVIIRNSGNGKSVVGGLFRREVDNPGPRIQVSSEAAASLGMLAGQPMVLDVVALRREEVVIEAPESEQGEVAPLATDGIEASSLDPLASAAAAIDAADGAGAIQPAPAAAAAPAPAPAPAATSALEKPYIQIGIFSQEDNAENTATSLRNVGILPTVLAQESSGKKFWRVVVGPSNTTAERRQLLAQVRKLGFEDAYFTTN